MPNSASLARIWKIISRRWTKIRTCWFSASLMLISETTTVLSAPVGSTMRVERRLRIHTRSTRSFWYGRRAIMLPERLHSLAPKPHSAAESIARLFIEQT